MNCLFLCILRDGLVLGAPYKSSKNYSPTDDTYSEEDVRSLNTFATWPCSSWFFCIMLNVFLPCLYKAAVVSQPVMSMCKMLLNTVEYSWWKIFYQDIVHLLVCTDRVFCLASTTVINVIICKSISIPTVWDMLRPYACLSKYLPSTTTVIHSGYVC